jgi:hypothetical protein
MMGVDPMKFDTPSPYDREALHLPPSLITEYCADDNYQPGLFIEMGGERLRAPESALDSGCYT